jgi:hypothetical protein
VVLAGACNDDNDVQPNPHFTAGSSAVAGAPSAGEPSTNVGGGSSAMTSGGVAGEGGVPATGGAAPLPEGGAGAGGAPMEQPPYDCVLHPKTHLEIINACTGATRIEKHPNLPPIP